MKMSNAKTKKKAKRSVDPLAAPMDDYQYNNRPMSAFETGMELDDVDLDMFSGTVSNGAAGIGKSIVEDDQMSMMGWRVKSQKRTWVPAPAAVMHDPITEAETDDVSQSLLALDKVIDEYDPYSLNQSLTGSMPVSISGSIKRGVVPTSGDAEHGDYRNDEIRKSLEALDSVLDEYDEGDTLSLAGSTRRPPSGVDPSWSAPQPNANGGQSRRHSGHVKSAEEDLPPPPPDILRPGAGRRPHSIHSTTDPELYSRSSKRSSRPPPQVPRRNPETRLSSGSTESQEQLDLSQFQYDDSGNHSYGLTHQSSQEYSPQHGYHGYPGDPYSPPPARNGDNGHVYGHTIGGAPPAPSLPPGSGGGGGGGLPPPLPPGRNSLGSLHSGGSMPPYSAPHYPTDPYNNGPRSLSPPPPPPGFDMGSTITSPPSSASSSQPEELYETRLPARMDEVPAHLLQQQHVGAGGENFYGSQLPMGAPMHGGGMDNGYPSPHELYETTLPKPGPTPHAPPPPQLPNSSSSSVLRRSSSSSSSSHTTHSSYAGSDHFGTGNVHLQPMMGGMGHTASPDTDFPPPPPPQFFQSVPSAPSSMPGSPQRPPPPTLPKTYKPTNGGPPPPPPLSTMPRTNNHHQNNQQYGGPPPPPPPSHHHQQQHDSAALAAQLQSVNLRTTSPPEDRLTKPLVNAHSDLISQIHTGVTLRKSPAGKKIRGADEPRVEDSGDTFSETASVTSSGSGEDYSGSSTGSRPPPPTLPKPSKPSPIHTNTMPSGGSNNSNHSSTTSDDIDASDVGPEGSSSCDVTQIEGYQPVPEGCPEWKKAMLERKNAQLIDQARKVKAEKDKESEKWKGVPEWKKALIMDREKKKEDEQNPQEEEMRKRKEEELRLQNMPEWKRALYIKKKGDM